MTENYRMYKNEKRDVATGIIESKLRVQLVEPYLPELVKRVTEVIEVPVVALFFGSVACDMATRKSEVDIALRIQKEISAGEGDGIYWRFKNDREISDFIRDIPDYKIDARLFRRTLSQGWVVLYDRFSDLGF